MYDDKFLMDYATRIKKIYDNNINSDNNFTLTFSLFCGLISVIDKEVRKEIFSKIELPKYINPTKNSILQDEKIKTVAIMRHFRNSLCHFKVDRQQIISDNQGNIIKIVFKDKYFKENKKICNFSCELNIEELNNFFNFILEKIIVSGK